MKPRIWLIAGPTASGKSALALRLAKMAGAEIVNADSMQLYRDLRVLSARPSPEEEAQAPHHLFGTVDAADGWSVGRWLRAASEVLDQIAARGRPAVLVGGTGLYFRALTQGLAEIPQVPAEVRGQAQADYDLMGESAFRGRLAAYDSAAALRIAPGDRQRLVRAWEVFAATDTPLSDWQSTGEPALARDAWRAIALQPPREGLYARCDARLAAMVEGGALEEVRALVARDLDPALPALKAVGVREFAAHLRGEATLAEALAAAQQETRRYAKRQTTWMRNQMADWPRLTEIDADGQWRQFLALFPGLTA
ncbi:tRNA (adenosine(37)-N6)-dimethylallyltransferase MiaA [Phenylobacterium sp.]|jgi:tRNA dimethylallyltransferase|uniref:tRNA (adenosine(37)-N6)-dimethylallyltransferase MiaA n=1 Tax=Phenylobacterium sp. TaxID=1871053 RepID=UPI002E308F64|nr:tRNA (adenosine(37)-N6)-dimethylallyltransferase MiaA [Phenylobacterium sp.]HEX4709232.1 tRNA (adenosine(37)-N6)-dimethylallyltransferase MiaA [Phenylobacterium sp.]